MPAKKAEKGHLKLSAVLDLNEASILHGKLGGMRGANIVIDASGVERVGVQCAQVLVAAARAWNTEGKTFAVEKASDAFDKTMQLIGVNLDNVVAQEI